MWRRIMSARKLQPPSLMETSFWSQWTSMFTQERIAQAQLLITPPQLHIEPLLDRVLTSLLCVAQDSPCGLCSACSKVLQDIHPDVHYIQPEVAEGQIKIEQIRLLQHTVYQTPQLGMRSVVVLKPVDGLNTAAASALLKILEEPPPATIFVLLTTQPDLLLPTLWSRCQPYRIATDAADHDPLSLGKMYPETSVKAVLYTQRLTLLADLTLMLEGQLNPCELAERWSSFPLADILWFLYAVTAKLIDRGLRDDVLLEADYQDLGIFSKDWAAERLFLQLDAIQDLMSKLQRNINLNPLLALERVLIEWSE